MIIHLFQAWLKELIREKIDEKYRSAHAKDEPPSSLVLGNDLEPSLLSAQHVSVSVIKIVFFIRVNTVCNT